MIWTIGSTLFCLWQCHIMLLVLNDYVQKKVVSVAETG